MNASNVTATRPLDLLRLSGSPREMGRQHGEARRAMLRRWHDDQFFRIGRLAPHHAGPDALRAAAWRYHARIAAASAALVEEIEGVAEGAGLPYVDALVCQLRRELIGYTPFAQPGAMPPARGDCSLAAVRATRPFLAQTVDLAGGMAEFAQVLHYAPQRGVPILMLSFAGLLGYMGINAHGLAVGINLVLGGAWGPGMPAYLLVRRLLECDSAAQALRMVAAGGHASSRALTLMDAHELITVEFTPGACRVLHAEDSLLHTNHFLHPELRACEAINVFALAGSRRRLQALQQRLPRVEPGADDALVMTGLFGHGSDQAELCVHEGPDLRAESTAAAVVVRPAEGRLPPAAAPLAAPLCSPFPFDGVIAMTAADIRADVRTVLCDALCMQEGELDDATLLSDYGLSSIDLLDVVAKLEARYAIKFQPESMIGLSAGTLVRNVESLRATA